jgi:hypothetical protein
MEAPRYLHLPPGYSPPDLAGIAPFKAVLVAECEVAPEWQSRVCDWLVRSGCLYAVAWGVKCEAWHDGVDLAHLAMFNYEPSPEDKFVMTSWHEGEPLSEAFWFSEMCASHPTIELEAYIVHIAPESREAEMIAAYRAAQTLADDAPR